MLWESPTVDDLAREILRRLEKDEATLALDNPLEYLRRSAIDIENERNKNRPCTSPDPLVEQQKTVKRIQAMQRLRTTLDALPALQRELLGLHVTKGQSYLEIAASKGLPHEVVLRELTLAYSRLSIELTRETRALDE